MERRMLKTDQHDVGDVCGGAGGSGGAGAGCGGDGSGLRLVVSPDSHLRVGGEAYVLGEEAVRRVGWCFPSYTTPGAFRVMFIFDVSCAPNASINHSTTQPLNREEAFSLKTTRTWYRSSRARPGLSRGYPKATPGLDQG